MGKDETMGKIFENFTIFIRRSWIMFPVVDLFFCKVSIAIQILVNEAILPSSSLVAQMVKNLLAVRETRVQSESGRSPGEGNGNPLQYSCLENSMTRRAWQATVHGVAKGQTGLSNSRFWSRRNCNDCTLTKNQLERKFTLVFSFFSEFDVMFIGFQIFFCPTQVFVGHQSLP